MKQPSPRGFVALLSVLILSAQLLSVCIGLQSYASYLQEAVSDEFSYRQAFLNAETCAEFARERISIDVSRFDDSKDLRVVVTPTIQCEITQVVASSTSARISTRGLYGKSSVAVQFFATRENMLIPYVLTTWEEL